MKWREEFTKMSFASVLDVLRGDVDHRAVGFSVDGFGDHRVAEHAAAEEAGLT